MLRGIGICSLLVCLVCAGHSVVSAQVTFAPAGYNSGSTGTSSIANGDFNNDGILDLVTVNAGTLSFYKGIGAGKFAAPVNQPLPANLGQVVAADFNRDGKLDLAIASSGQVAPTGSITILLGKGDGTFVPGANIAVAGTPLKIALGDFNGDHQPDVAASACNTSTCTLQVFLGQGNGTLTQSATLTAGGGWVAAGDFNADGRQDLAVIANGGNQLAMYLGNGNGTFQSPILANQNVAISLAVGDFYSNRIQSLAVLRMVPNNGNFNYYISTVRYVNGALAITTPELASTDQFYSGIAAGDLNGDFIDDVVMVGGNVRSYPLTGYLLGKGDGTFQPYASAPAYGEGENFPFIRDLNRDSRHDIGTSWDSSYAGNGGGAFALLNTTATKNCAPPKANALSGHICAPSSGQTVGQSFTFRAAGNAFNGVAKRMELWIDGRKVGQNLEDQLKVKAALTKGPHTASFVVVDTFDNHVSQSVSFTSSY